MNNPGLKSAVLDLLKSSRELDKELSKELKEKKLSTNHLDPDFSLQLCSGGDTHQSFSLHSSLHSDGLAETYFVKVNRIDQAPVLESEAESLRRLAKLFPGAYPRFIAEGTTTERVILIMTFHPLERIRAENAASLGTLLAKQHAIKNHQCGWFDDNFIGSSAQKNSWMTSWPEFFLQTRLEPQLATAVKNSLPAQVARKAQRVLNKPPSAFTNHRPSFSLVHGDLWSGNVGYNTTEMSTMLYDPAPYFGDPEVDIAMTELFGRFPREFYASYYAMNPINPGYEIRREVYNLYHALNHFNLFGDSYLSLVSNGLDRLRFDN